MTDIGDKIQLQDVYTDSIDLLKETNVYGNGRMQVMVFPSVSYHGENSEEDIENVKSYVAEHTKIHAVKMDGQTEPLDTNVWVQESTSNEFLHDIYRSATLSSSSTKTLYDIRVPLFFVVPTAALGPYRWIAELNGEYTKLTDAITITCVKLTLSLDNFVITEMEKQGQATLKVLQYNLAGSLANTTTQLTQCYENKGILFTNPPAKEWGNCWFIENWPDPVRATCFISKEKQTVSVGKKDASYSYDDTFKTENCPFDVSNDLKLTPVSLHDDDPYNDATKLNLDASRKLGIPMLCLKDAFLAISGSAPPAGYYYDLEDFKVEDNFGNILEISFDWLDWKVKKFSIIFI